MSNQIHTALESALEETFAAASALLPRYLRRSFVLVRGAALVRWGARRKTVDVDIACSQGAILAFFENSKLDRRFSIAPDRVTAVEQCAHHCANTDTDTIEYTALLGTSMQMSISIDLLVIGDEAVPRINRLVQMPGGFVALLEDLFFLKGRTYVAEREKQEKDKSDFVWLVEQLRTRNIQYDPLLLLMLL